MHSIKIIFFFYAEHLLISICRFTYSIFRSLVSISLDKWPTHQIPFLFPQRVCEGFLLVKCIWNSTFVPLLDLLLFHPQNLNKKKSVIRITNRRLRKNGTFRGQKMSLKIKYNMKKALKKKKKNILIHPKLFYIVEGRERSFCIWQNSSFR